MLRYFFTAYYNDQTFFNQNPEDASLDKPGKSAYSDVDHDRLIGFSLASETAVYAVDLITGTFLVNNAPFRMVEEGEAVGPFKLIFWRRHKHTISSIVPEPGMQPRFQELSHVHVYRMGWEATDPRTGRKVERVMEID